jgi:beta-lactamase class A
MSTLRSRIDDVAEKAGASQVAVSVYDYAAQTAWSLRGAQAFHAASTIKVAVMFALYAAFDEGDVPADGRLHVRNRFLSIVDGSPYRIDASRDQTEAVFAARGRTMRLRALVEHMIQTSSNLATNLLVDLLGPARIEATLHEHDVPGVNVVRGVEDARAWEEGINNTVTADGLVRLFRVIQEGNLSEESTDEMREVLLGQRFRSGIPGGLPESVRAEARVAHKTGEISTVAHDAGLVFLPDRPPYAIAILTEWDDSSTNGRRAMLADISRLLYDYVTGTDG